jgi:iron complex transport system substrate-binding protein
MPKNHFKLLAPVLLCVVLISSITGCGNTAKTSTPAISTPSAPTQVSATQLASTSKTRVIVDMYGRRITVPDPINRVLCTGPVEAELVYLIAPDKLAGLAAAFDGNPPLVPDQYANLPVIGAWYGAQVGNYETFMKDNPDIILEGKLENLPERQQKFGSIPVVGDDTGSDLLLNFQKCITFIGDLLDAQESAAKLNAYYAQAMQYVTGIVSQIPASDRVRVYYAEGLDGLNTDPIGSFHNNLIDFCGGVNVAVNIPMIPGYGMSQVSLENILLWDPDMIILGRATPAGLYQTIMTDAEWGKLKAVEDKRVYVRPDNPLSVFDGPPGPCQILGMYWMIHTLYPDKTRDLDLNARFKEFYSDFLHYDLTDDEVSYLLDNQL